MERNAHYLIVGIFVVTTLVMATILFVWISGSYDTKTYKQYSVYFHGFVNGLSEGSTVSYRGVNVGRVLSIRFDPDHPERIKTTIEIEESTPISTSTSVSLKAVGITGLSELAIKTENASGNPLTAPEGEQYPVIPSKRSGISQLLDDAPQVTDKTIQVLERVNALLSKNNIAKINTALENLEQASANFNMILSENNIQRIDTTLESLEQASTNFNEILNEENAQSIAKMLKTLNTTTARLDRILSKNAKQIESFTGDNLDEIAILVRDTRETVNAFKILAQKLSDNPSQILYQPNYEGVKVQQ